MALRLKAPQINGFKMNQVEGNSCYKKQYRYVFKRDNLILTGGEGIQGNILSRLDYGNRVYALVDVNGQNILVNIDRDYSLDTVSFLLSGDDIAIYQKEIDMRIC